MPGREQKRRGTVVRPLKDASLHPFKTRMDSYDQLNLPESVRSFNRAFFNFRLPLQLKEKILTRNHPPFGLIVSRPLPLPSS